MNTTSTNGAAESDFLPNGCRHLMPMIRVACIELEGSTLIVPASELQRHIEGFDTGLGAVEGDESETFSLTFKTMLVRDYEALGDFDGF